MTTKQKIIGIIGGVSWESTALYYKLLNQAVREHFGGLNSAKIVLFSLNYEEIVSLERQDKWTEVGDKLAHAAQVLEKAGADFIILCCNTLHKVTPFIEAALQIPFLHIADAAGMILTNNNVKKIGLLGTQFTMEDGFYSTRLNDKFNLELIIPSYAYRKNLDSIIYNELCQGKIALESKQKLINMIQVLNNEGAEAILLGCTELGMLINQNDFNIPIYDTTLLHANEAASLSMHLKQSMSC